MESFDEIVMQYLYCIAELQFCIQFKQFLTTFKFKHFFKGFDNENFREKINLLSESKQFSTDFPTLL